MRVEIGEWIDRHECHTAIHSRRVRQRGTNNWHSSNRMEMPGRYLTAAFTEAQSKHMDVTEQWHLHGSCEFCIISPTACRPSSNPSQK